MLELIKLQILNGFIKSESYWSNHLKKFLTFEHDYFGEQAFKTWTFGDI